MLKRVSRSIEARRLAAWQMSELRWVAKADPLLQWREINARVNAVLSTLPPLPDDFPDAKQSWADFLVKYEKRKAEGAFSDPAAADEMVYGRRPGNPPQPAEKQNLWAGDADAT